MNWKSASLVGGMAVCVLCAPAIAQAQKQWIEVKSPQELRALYTNKTFRGNGWTGHYRADGKGIMVSQGRTVPRTWKVTGNDQVCVTPQGAATACFRFARHREFPHQFAITNVKNGMVHYFTLEDGIPKF